jgi:hypothetical protein
VSALVRRDPSWEQRATRDAERTLTRAQTCHMSLGPDRLRVLNELPLSRAPMSEWASLDDKRIPTSPRQYTATEIAPCTVRTVCCG